MLHDQERDPSLLNTSSVASYLGLGALIESLVIAATARGLQASVTLLSAADGPVAQLHLSEGSDRVDPHATWLGRRATNRHDGDGTPLHAEARDALAAHASRLGVGLCMVEGDSLQTLADLLGRADRIRFLNPALHADLVRELRWTPEEAEQARDGLDIRTLGLDTAGQALLELLSRGDAMATLRAHDLGHGLARIGRSATTSASAALLFTVPDTSWPQLCRGGQALQRVWLEAARLGLGFQPIGASLFMHRMLQTSAGQVFRPDERQVVAEVMAGIRELFECEEDAEPVFLCRVHRPVATDETQSLRRTLAAVLQGTDEPPLTGP